MKNRSRALFVNEHFSHINTPEFGFTSARTRRGWKKKSWGAKKCIKRWVTGKRELRQDASVSGGSATLHLCQITPPTLPLPLCWDQIVGDITGDVSCSRENFTCQTKVCLRAAGALQMSDFGTNTLIKTFWIWNCCPLAKKKEALVLWKISISQFHFHVRAGLWPLVTSQRPAHHSTRILNRRRKREVKGLDRR